MIIVIVTDKEARKIRHTHQREAILAFLRSRRHHWSAAEVYDAVRREIPSISLGTVYRNLGQLVEMGEIITVETEDKCVWYDGYVKHHTHFVCRDCKEIYDFEYETKKPEEITSQGFEIEHERTVYYGLCKKCQK